MIRTWITKRNHQRITQLLAGRSNAFLLQSENVNILIDTGMKGQWRQLTRRLASLKVDRLDYLILTHTHNDHAANAGKIRARYHPHIIVHRAEQSYLTQGIPLIPKGTNHYSRTLVNVFGKVARPWFRYDPCPCDITVGDELNLRERGVDARILHTPGHSSGSMTLIVDEEIALVGDVMIGRGVHYTYPPFADDPPELIRSWKKLLDTPCRLFIPSHGWANTRELVEKVYTKKKKDLNLDNL